MAKVQGAKERNYGHKDSCASSNKTIDMPKSMYIP